MMGGSVLINRKWYTHKLKGKCFVHFLVTNFFFMGKHSFTIFIDFFGNLRYWVVLKYLKTTGAEFQRHSSIERGGTMQSSIIPTRFDIISPWKKAKNQVEKGAKRLPFNLHQMVYLPKKFINSIEVYLKHYSYYTVVKNCIIGCILLTILHD